MMVGRVVGFPIGRKVLSNMHYELEQTILKGYPVKIYPAKVYPAKIYPAKVILRKFIPQNLRI